MPQESLARNPFLMMLNPEIVLAAVERSERLGQLNRHLCRPLDRPIGQKPGAALDDSAADESSDESSDASDAY